MYTDSGCTQVVVGAGLDVMNHCVAIVGWGRDATSNLDYWIMRNQVFLYSKTVIAEFILTYSSCIHDFFFSGALAGVMAAT